MKRYVNPNPFHTLAILLCIMLLMAIPVDSQYSGFTIAPPNSAVGYGGLFNPYVFWPGVGIKTALSTSSLVPLLSSIFGNSGLLTPFPNLFVPPIGQLSLGTYSLGSPLQNLIPSTMGLFNPTFGFGTSLGALSQSGLGILNPLSLAASLPLSVASAIPLTPAAALRTAAQSGTWVGTWQSTYIAFPILWNSGPMTLNFVEDPVLGTVVGTAVLADSRYASIPFEVAGVIVNNTISVEGFLYTGFDCALTGYFTSPTTMSGFYTVLGTHIPVLDEGIFNLTLTPAVIF